MAVYTLVQFALERPYIRQQCFASNSMNPIKISFAHSVARTCWLALDTSRVYAFINGRYLSQVHVGAVRVGVGK